MMYQTANQNLKSIHLMLTVQQVIRSIPDNRASISLVQD